jgi:replicative DNA helicase
MKGEITDLLPELKQAMQSYEPTAQRLSIIEGNFDTGVDEIREVVSKHISLTGENPVVFVDYLQILKGKGKLSDKQEIDQNVTELKRMSRDFNIPVVVISSLNRQNYSSPIGFESFKESGSIEYTADTIMGLQLSGIKTLDHTEKNRIANREKINQMKNENPRKVELVILKNRNGQAYSSQEYDFYPVTNLFKEC